MGGMGGDGGGGEQGEEAPRALIWRVCAASWTRWRGRRPIALFNAYPASDHDVPTHQEMALSAWRRVRI